MSVRLGSRAPNSMKTVIAGSRGINSYRLLKKAINESGIKDNITEVISGGARGVDRMGFLWAEEFHIPVAIFLPDWKRYGNRAGILRNIEMIDYADALIALWDGESKGTRHSIDYAIKRDIYVWVALHTYSARGNYPQGGPEG